MFTNLDAREAGEEAIELKFHKKGAARVVVVTRNLAAKMGVELSRQAEQPEVEPEVEPEAPDAEEAPEEEVQEPVEAEAEVTEEEQPESD